jgi:acyl carrier protein
VNSIVLEQVVREVVGEHGKLTAPIATVGSGANLFDLGMDSQAVIRVLLGIEDRLDISFPDDALTRDTFSSITTILAALSKVDA